MRSTCGVPVSACAAALGRPAGADVGVVDQHVEGARLDAHHVGDRPDRGRRAQHADDLARRLPDRRDSRRPPPPRSTAPSPRRSGRAARRRRPTADRRRRPSCAGSRSRRPRASGGRFMAMDLRSSMARRVSCSWSFALISDWKALNSARNPDRAALTSICGLVGPRRGSPRPGLAFSFLHRSLSLTTARGRPHASISLASRKVSARVRARSASASGRIGLHPRLGEHREGDERHLPELDLVQQPLAAAGLLAPERAVADRQPVDRAGLQQHVRLARRLHLEEQPALDEQPPAVLAHLVPDPDRPGRVVLPQHLHPATPPWRAGRATRRRRPSAPRRRPGRRRRTGWRSRRSRRRP